MFIGGFHLLFVRTLLAFYISIFLIVVIVALIVYFIAHYRMIQHSTDTDINKESLKLERIDETIEELSQDISEEFNHNDIVRETVGHAEVKLKKTKYSRPIDDDPLSVDNIGC